MSYYLASDEVKKLQIQIGGLTSMWVVGCLSLPLSVLLVMVRVFFYYLEVQTNVDVTEKSVLQGASSEAEPAAEDPDAPVMQKTQIGVQRSARPRAQRSAPPGTAGATPAGRDGELSDVGIIFSPVPKGLKITGLKPGTNAADSELAKGDTVFMIDEQFTAGISMSDAIAALCGPSQSPVDLTARRESNKGPPSKVYATILRDSPHNPTEWLARWNAASEASKFNLAKIFEPLSAAARACMDVATGKVPVRSLFNKVRGVVALGTSSVQNSISPDAKLATAKKRREAAHAAQKMSMQEAALRQDALQREIEDAYADGVVTEEEQRQIDAKQAELDAAKKAQDEATAAANAAAAEAKALLAKALADAEEMKKQSKDQADQMLKQAQEAAQRLQQEVEDAMADGVVTEEEQRQIDAKQAELDAAKKAQDEATAAANANAAEAKALLSKAQSEAEEMKKQSKDQADQMLKQAQEAAQQQAKLAQEILKRAEDEAQQKMAEAAKAAARALEDAEAKKASLAKEMEEAMADGIITEEEQRQIDAKQAALDEAEKAKNEAAQAAAVAAARAATVLAKAEADAQAMKAQAEADAAWRIRQAQEEASRHAAEAAAAAKMQAEAQAAERLRQVEEEAQKRYSERLIKAENEAKKVTEEAAAAAAAALKEAEQKKAALQKEIDDALADGVITEEEQRAIDAKQAAFDAAQRANDEAVAAAAEAAAHAKMMREEAEAEAEEIRKQSEARVSRMLMQAEEEVNKKVAAAKASADKTTREATAAAQRKVAESTKKVQEEMLAIEEAKRRAEKEAKAMKTQAQAQAQAMMQQAQQMLDAAKREAQRQTEIAAKIMKDAMADGVIDAEEQKAIDAANAAQRKAQLASSRAAERTGDIQARTQAFQKQVGEQERALSSAKAKIQALTEDDIRKNLERSSYKPSSSPPAPRLLTRSRDHRHASSPSPVQAHGTSPIERHFFTEEIMVPQQIMHRDGTVEIVNTVQVLTKVVEYARTPVRSNVSTRQASPPPTFGISRTEKVKATRSAPPNATRSARTAQRSAAPQHVAAKAAYDDMPLINMEDEVFNDGKVHTRQQSMALVRSASKAQRSAAPLQAKCLSMSPGMDPRDVTTKAEFDALIEKTGDQLIVVDFTAAWCGPCQKIKPIFNALANEYAHVIFVKVDVDDNQETAAACNVKDMPTFQFYKMGKMVHSIRGADQQALRDGVEQHHAPTPSSQELNALEKELLLMAAIPIGAKAARDNMPIINVEDELFNNGMVYNRQQRMAAQPVAPANTSPEPSARQPTVASTMSTTWFSSPKALHTSQTPPKFVDQTTGSPPRSSPQSVNRSTTQSVNSSQHVGLGLQLGLTAIDYPGQDREVEVTEVVTGFAADADGTITIGDIVVAIDGVQAKGKELHAIKQLTIGEVGTVCILDMKRVVRDLRDWSRMQNQFFSCILTRTMPERVDGRNADCVLAILQGEDLIDAAYAKAGKATSRESQPDFQGTTTWM